MNGTRRKHKKISFEILAEFNTVKPFNLRVFDFRNVDNHLVQSSLIAESVGLIERADRSVDL